MGETQCRGKAGIREIARKFNIFDTTDLQAQSVKGANGFRIPAGNEFFQRDQIRHEIGVQRLFIGEAQDNRIVSFAPFNNVIDPVLRSVAVAKFEFFGIGLSCCFRKFYRAAFQRHQQDVIASLPAQQVIAGAAIQNIVASPAAHIIIGRAANDGVIAIPGIHHQALARFCCGDDIIASAGIQDNCAFGDIGADKVSNRNRVASAAGGDSQLFNAIHIN